MIFIMAATQIISLNYEASIAMKTPTGTLVDEDGLEQFAHLPSACLQRCLGLA